MAEGRILRKWLIRSGILVLAGGVAAAVWAYRSYTSPEAVRRMLVAALEGQMPGVRVEVDSARLRLFGGVTATGLRFTRRGQPAPFLVVPEARIYHDKERLSKGRLAFRKLELRGPRLTLTRLPDGSWDVPNLSAGGPTGEALPSLVITGGVAVVSDRAASPPTQWKLTGLKLTAVNDPLDRVTADAVAEVAGVGRVSVRGTWHRAAGRIDGHIDVTNADITAALLGRLAGYVPELRGRSDALTGTASLHVGVSRAGGQSPWDLDARLSLKDGRLTDPELPLPLQGLAMTARYRRGRVEVESASARAGDSRVSLRMGLTAEPAGEAPPDAPPLPGGLGPRVRHMRVTVEHLTVGRELIARLPESLRSVPEMFRPRGPLDVTYSFRRLPGASWKKTVTVRPRGMGAAYRQFAYPVSGLGGKVELTETAGRPPVLTVDLSGEAGGRPLTVAGRMVGANPGADMDFTVVGSLPFGDALFDTLPPPYPAFLRSLHLRGGGDFRVELRQAAGTSLLHKRYVIDVKGARIEPDHFRYELTGLGGRLVAEPAPSDLSRPGAPRPDGRLTVTDFRARHGETEVTLNGTKTPSGGGSDLDFRVGWKNLRLDDDLERAVTRLGGGDLWRRLGPSGTASGSARVLIRRHADGRPFVASRDLRLGVGWAGGSVTPDRFRYRLDHLRGKARYVGGRLELFDWTADHGPGRWSLAYADIRPRRDGGRWIGLRDFRIRPLVYGPELAAAMPAEARRALDRLGLTGPAAVRVRKLVIDDPAAAPARFARGQSPGSEHGPRKLPAPRPVVDPPPVVFWDGELTLHGASVKLGVPLTGMVGKAASRGRYEDGRLRALSANVHLGSVRVARQPVRDVLISVQNDPYRPEVLRVPSARAGLFGGTVSGSARVELGEVPVWSVDLTAADVRLEQVARHYELDQKASLSGAAHARLYLSNAPEVEGMPPALRGGGVIDVPDGKLYRKLPLLLDLLKLWNMRAPDGVAFEQARAVFRVRGERVHVDQLDLLGNAVSLGGRGELGTDGKNLDFEFYTVWSRLLKKTWAEPIDRLSSAVSSGLFKIELRGDVGGKLEYRRAVVPVVAEPIRGVLDRLRRY